MSYQHVTTGTCGIRHVTNCTCGIRHVTKCTCGILYQTHRRMRRGAGGQLPPPKFGQTVGEIRANSGGNSGKARRKNRPEKATN